MRKKFWFVLDHAEELFLVAAFLLLVFVTFLQVIMRFVFNNSLPWPEELGKYIFVWVSWIGISIGAKKGEHIKIEMLSKKLPFRPSQALNILTELAVIVIVVITGYYGILMCQYLLGVGIRNVALWNVNQAVGMAAIPVGCFLMILRSIQSICRSVMAIKNGPPTELVGEIEEGGGN